MNTKFALLSLMFALSACAPEAPGLRLPPERIAENERLSIAWYARCVDDDACVGTLVDTPRGLFLVVAEEDMPYNRPHVDYEALRVTEDGVELWLHNQAFTDHPLVTAFTFPERPEARSVSDS